MDDAEIAAVVRRAARALASRAGANILTAEVVDARDVTVKPSGWAEIGRLEDAFGRCFWDVLYHPATGTGRLVRGFPKAKRGVMGEILDERD